MLVHGLYAMSDQKLRDELQDFIWNDVRGTPTACEIIDFLTSKGKIIVDENDIDCRCDHPYFKKCHITCPKMRENK